MHLFTDYIQPFTFWLYAHPHWALFITFFIAFSESLAIVGSLIPGSVTMTAIGILAGSGVMRIDLTFLAATLGAIAGDSGSYILGYLFSDRLTNIWPFKRYPNWLDYGKDYFARHGSTSILIGRFVGPMRSIIPVIAGMMRMNRWHFLVANIISGVGWAFLYVIPGVLIGIASSELSAESATRLFALILMLLIIIWILSLGLKWLFTLANQFLGRNLNEFWIWLSRNPRLGYYSNFLTPAKEVNHYPTAALTIVLVLCFCISIITVALVIQSTWVAAVNNPVYFLIQSLRTQPFDIFFTVIILIINPLALLALMMSITMYAIYYQDWRTIRYWLSLCFTSGVVIFLLTLLVDIPKPNGLAKHYTTPTFPIIDLTLATAMLGFLMVYLSAHYRTVTVLILRISLLIILFLSGLALIYLGDNWLTSVLASYFIGATICLLYWLFYRRCMDSPKRSQLPVILSCLILALAAYISCLLYFKKLIRAHSPHHAQFVMTDQVWWNQQRSMLPIYSTNRIGRPIGLLNIQYAGSIIKLQHTLEESGWKPQSNSFFYSLLLRAGGQNAAEELPLMAQLYLDRKPILLMTYNPDNKQTLLVLRLWRSNYHLRHYRQPVWLGSVMVPPQVKDNAIMLQQPMALHNNIIRSLHGFKFNQITLPKRDLKLLPNPTSPVLLMVKEPDPEDPVNNESDTLKPTNIK